MEHSTRYRKYPAGLGFLLLAAYVTWDATASLLKREAPERSTVGIAIAVLSLVVMPVLARAKRRTAKSLGSPALQADSRQTSICAYLSVKYLTRYFETRTLTPFAIYCVVAGGASLAWLLLH